MRRHPRPQTKSRRVKKAMLENVRYDQRYDSLLVVYRFGSYTQAASSLALTPSAVSQQIHSVERELGTTLFVRRKNRLAPTAECELVVKNVQRIHALCRQMSDGIDLSRRHIDRLCIGVTPSAENYALSGVLLSPTDTDPPLQLKITSGSADELCGRLKNHEIDLAVIEGPCNTDGFVSVLMDTDHLTVVVPPGSSFANDGMITVSRLLSERLILKPQSSGTRVLFESSLKSAGVPIDRLNVIMELDGIDTIVRLVNSGYGLSVLSNNACREYVQRGDIAVVSLEGISMCRTVRMLYRPGDDMQSMIKTIQHYYNSPADAVASKEDHNAK